MSEPENEYALNEIFSRELLAGIEVVTAFPTSSGVSWCEPAGASYGVGAEIEYEAEAGAWTEGIGNDWTD